MNFASRHIEVASRLHSRPRVLSRLELVPRVDGREVERVSKALSSCGQLIAHGKGSFSDFQGKDSRAKLLQTTMCCHGTLKIVL